MDNEPTTPGLAIVRQIDIESTARDWTRAELLRQADVSQSTYARYVSGEREMGVDTLIKIADALDLAPSVLLARAEERFDAAFSSEKAAKPPRKAAAASRKAERLGEPRAAEAARRRTTRPANGRQKG